MALTYNTMLKNELIKLIYEEIERLKENLTMAYHTEGFDFASYKHLVGRIEGLRTALELCEQAETTTNGAT